MGYVGEAADSDMDASTEALILAQVEREVDAQVREENRKVADMDILKRIADAHGVIDRVTANVDAKLETVFALEKKAEDLSNRATAPKIAQLDTINAHLTEVVNALEGNGGPPLDGEKQSTPSDGASAENPTKPA